MSCFYKKGLDRKSEAYFPPSIDECVSEENIVRVIDAYVETLDMEGLGFTNASLNSKKGQPAFHPKLLLKIYIYTYLNKIRSSRMIEQEIKRNIELIWLTKGLYPGYKTIANFRKDNSKALQNLFKAFVMFLKNIDLIAGDLVMVDGVYLKANASKNAMISKKGTKVNLTKVENEIKQCLLDLDMEDKKDKIKIKLEEDIKQLNQDKETAVQEKDQLAKDISALQMKSQKEKREMEEKLEILKEKEKKLRKNLEFLEENNLNQYNRTDPDASVMAKPGQNLVAYNVQSAVDTEHNLIVATDVSTIGNDSQELHKMGTIVKENLDIDTVKIGADTGYYNPKEIKKCLEDDIEPFVSIPDKEKAQRDKGKFPRSAFKYNKENDSYLCPNDSQLKNTNRTQNKNDKILYLYKSDSSQCKNCPLKEKCLGEKTPYKQLYRWENEDIIDEFKEKMNTDEAKEVIRARGATVEHPFGTIKMMLGWPHFLVRGQEKVAGENALIMFNYNFKRAINIIGIPLLIEMILAVKKYYIERKLLIYLEILIFLNEFFKQNINISNSNIYYK